MHSLIDFIPVDRDRRQGRFGRKDPAQRRIYEDRHGESEQPVEGIEVPRPSGDIHRVSAVCSQANGVPETGQVWTGGHKKGDQSAPVDAVPVSVSPVGVVERGNVDVLLLHQPVIGGEDAGDGGEEDGVSAHEREERLRRREDLPGHNHPASDDGGEHASPLDVDVAGEEDGEIVGRGDGVGGDVRADLCDIPRCCGEEGSSASAVAGVKPFANDIQRIP